MYIFNLIILRAFYYFIVLFRIDVNFIICIVFSSHTHSCQNKIIITMCIYMSISNKKFFFAGKHHTLRGTSTQNYYSFSCNG